MTHDHDHTHTHSDGHDHESDASVTFEVVLKEKKEVADGTMEFLFEKPKKFEFRAGQHLDVTLINPPETDAEGNTRTFSLASAPSESYLAFATRMRDTAFKRVLKNMAVGTKVHFGNPHGSFTLHNDSSKPAVFLIGGIGITPVFSIIKEATERKAPHSLYLLYSNRRPEDAAFLEELKELETKNHRFIFVPTMTEPEKSLGHWVGETGVINLPLIEKYLEDVRSAVYYLSGPPGMVGAMRKLLVEAGVDEDNIRTEEFSGY